MELLCECEEDAADKEAKEKTTQPLTLNTDLGPTSSQPGLKPREIFTHMRPQWKGNMVGWSCGNRSCKWVVGVVGQT
eukprot:CAMPEP_0184297550 /NCGR_PEP_ID=MMETSP1049-20130417/8457_1 /TAXON_ID=77928 /ORGANISM="Proteomonas sulcata, Strain CCMP704" /LENGTH=76 /DNA_ID=CAMNT_0026607329 /DNA_START=664 /DNA_END=894 /DNA_ORIENTATION=-